MAPLRTRVCLIGPECTGKTTLAERLANHFDAPWVPEFAREYAATVGRLLTVDDVEPIARGQMVLEDAALAGVGSRESGVGDYVPVSDPRPPTPDPRDRLLILDTDLISTVVYATHYYGTCPEWIEAAARARKAGLYLLTDVDVPFIPDSLRDSAAPREMLFERFAQTLNDYDANVVKLTGNWQERWEAAIRQLGNRSDRPPAKARTLHR